MISSLSRCSPLASSQTPPAPQDPQLPDPGLEDQYAPEPSSDEHRGRKVFALSLLGLSGLTGTALAATHTAATLPLCQQQVQIASWENGHACVSMDTALKGATTWRYAQGLTHIPGALKSWNSQQNQVIEAPSNLPGTKYQPQELKVVSWNLHHGLSQDSTGARPQLDTMLDQLKEEKADLILLQEVTPGDATRLANDLNMQGYYAQSTAVQGNMILLRPDITVQDTAVTFTTGEAPNSGWQTLKEWVGGKGGAGEPRNLQILHVKMPDGQQATIWNTHHLTGSYSPQQHEQAANALLNSLKDSIRPGDRVIGGGDMNAQSPDRTVLSHLETLQDSGLKGQHDKIDWIYSNAPSQFSSQIVEQQKVMVSDHPLVRAQIDLQAHQPAK